jgi:Arc/MetJ-type ribon-helix-helix transcriptional regulator
MNIRLSRHSEELLKQQLAQGKFRSPEEVIESALESLTENSLRRTAMNLAEFEATLDALAEGSERLPVLPTEATTRAGIYRDHD